MKKLNIDPRYNPKTTLVGTLLLMIGLSFYCLDFVIELKKEVNHWVNGGMIISGVLLLIAPDKWIELVTNWVNSLIKKNDN